MQRPDYDIEQILQYLNENSEKLLLAANEFQSRNNLRSSAKDIVSAIKNLPSEIIYEAMQLVQSRLKQGNPSASSITEAKDILRVLGKKSLKKKATWLATLLDDNSQKNWNKSPTSKKPDKYNVVIIEHFIGVIEHLSGKNFSYGHCRRLKVKSGVSMSGPAHGDIDLLVASLNWLEAHVYFISRGEGPIPHRANSEGVLPFIKRLKKEKEKP